jgi:putative membrane protein
LEPFAIAHDLWRWQNEQVPIQNYVGWAVVSFLLLLPFHALNLRPRNPVSGWLFVLLNAFFAVTLLAGASDP